MLSVFVEGKVETASPTNATSCRLATDVISFNEETLPAGRLTSLFALKPTRRDDKVGLCAVNK